MGNVDFFLKLHTWTFSSFNTIQSMWYAGPNNSKIVPENIAQYLTPRALAYWIMDNGSKAGSGVKLATNSFRLTDLNLLCETLYSLYDLNCTIQSAGVENQYVIYIKAESKETLVKLVSPYMEESMMYKIGK